MSKYRIEGYGLAEERLAKARADLASVENAVVATIDASNNRREP